MIFVVDSNDKDRINEAKEELDNMVSYLVGSCCVILINARCFSCIIVR